MTATLDWGLCIATLNRGDVLVRAVGLALSQTRPPAEVVIVDASTDWQATRDRVAAVVGDRARLVFEPAAARSLTVQRNQAIRLARADILFLLDDDTLMYPDCAERIMARYAAHPSVVAIAAHHVPEAPENSAAGLDRKAVSSAAVGWIGTGSGAVARVLRRQLLLTDADCRFVGYDRADRRWHSAQPPQPPRHCHAIDFINGFALTVRRDAVLREPFDDGLVGPAIAEDLDASYRLGRLGALWRASDAHCHHLEAAGARRGRRVDSALAQMNVAYFVRRHSARPTRDLARLTLWSGRMTLADLAKDLAGRRWTLPRFRGSVLALTWLPRIWAAPRGALVPWYQTVQRRIMAGAR